MYCLNYTILLLIVNILEYFHDIVMHFQVQTTAKALAETRDKLIEEEKKKQMKESSRSLLSLNVLISEGR